MYMRVHCKPCERMVGGKKRSHYLRAKYIHIQRMYWFAKKKKNRTCLRGPDRSGLYYRPTRRYMYTQTHTQVLW